MFGDTASAQKLYIAKTINLTKYDLKIKIKNIANNWLEFYWTSSLVNVHWSVNINGSMSNSSGVSSWILKFQMIDFKNYDQRHWLKFDGIIALSTYQRMPKMTFSSWSVLEQFQKECNSDSLILKINVNDIDDVVIVLRP